MNNKRIFSFNSWMEPPSAGKTAIVVMWILFKLTLVAIFINEAPMEFIYAGF